MDELFDSQIAYGKGWEFDFNVMGKRVIVKAFQTPFRSDMEALAFVIWKAMQGSAYHMRALEINFE